jgi:sugar phosphate isomerase/epimerase
VHLGVITDEIDPGLGRALDVCEELGIRAVELRTVGGLQIVDHDSAGIQTIRDELDRRDFRVCSIASPFLKCDRDDDPGEQERVHERALAVAAALGAPVVRAFSYWREPEPAAVLPQLGPVLAAAADLAHAAGVTLAVENEHECNVATAAEAEALPHVRLIWDPGNAAMLDPAAYSGLGGLDAIRDRVAHVHVKDVSAAGEWTRVGDGVVDFAAQLRYLADTNYDGYVSFETHYQRDGSGELATRDCVAALRAIATQVGVELA